MFNCPATPKQIDSACMSFRHDFGLLDEKKREDTRFAAKYWLEAWMKEGMAFDVEGKANEVVKLREQVAELKEKLSKADCSADVECADLRTQVILLQSENRELKNQLEQVTDPAYLTKKLEALGVVDKKWQELAETKTEQVAALGAALKIAQGGLNDWLHTYATDLCDPEKVAAAQERVSKFGVLAYLANINEEIRQVGKLANDGETNGGVEQ